MTDFFLFSPQCTDKCIKTIYLIVINFSSPCFDVPKTWNFTSSGVQNRKTKNRRLGMIVTSFQNFKLCRRQISLRFSYFLINNTLLYYFLVNLLAHNKKITKKSVFCKAWCPEMTSCNFQSPVFRLAVLYPTRSEIKTWGKKINFDYIFCYTYQYIVGILSSK